MDPHKILNKHYLRFIWIADPKWHSVVNSGFSVITLLFDLLFSGKRSIFRLMQRLRNDTNDDFKDCVNLRFSYLYHYYTNRAIYNYGWLLYSRIENIKKALTQVQILGLNNFKRALSLDKGIIVFSAHVGCFFNTVFCERVIELINGRKVALLSLENMERRKQLIRNQVMANSPDLNFELIDIKKKTDAIKIFRTLKTKGIVGCTLDYAYPFTKNQQIRFFGRKVDFPVGAIEMGMKIDVIFLPCFSYIKNGQITLEFKEPFPSIKTESLKKDIDDISSKINKVLEDKIMEIPEQWSFWLRLS